MANPNLDAGKPPGLHLVSAFLAMEPTDSLLSLTRVCGGGLVTEGVQRFIWEHCISQADEKGYACYLKNFVKKVILEIESSNGTVLDELYEQYGYYMTSVMDDTLAKGNSRICKCISFLFPEGYFELKSCPKSTKLLVPLHCSLNILEGDTGCSIWPSSLYLSEFILSFPDIFSNKTCFEVGSGVGLVGICLSHVKASKIILSDGDPSTLANMKLNLELNQLTTETDVLATSNEDCNLVKAEMDIKCQMKCLHLPWESATERDLQEFTPDIILGADIIYNPSCLPHLIRLLAILLNPHGAGEQKVDQSDCNSNENSNRSDECQVKELHNRSSIVGLKKGRVAYIAAVIRSIGTFKYFVELAEQANLTVTEITETIQPLNLLPYMRSYNRSSIHLYTVGWT